MKKVYYKCLEDVDNFKKGRVYNLEEGSNQNLIDDLGIIQKHVVNPPARFSKFLHKFEPVVEANFDYRLDLESIKKLKSNTCLYIRSHKKGSSYYKKLIFCFSRLAPNGRSGYGYGIMDNYIRPGHYYFYATGFYEIVDEKKLIKKSVLIEELVEEVEVRDTGLYDLCEIKEEITSVLDKLKKLYTV